MKERVIIIKINKNNVKIKKQFDLINHYFQLYRLSPKDHQHELRGHGGGGDPRRGLRGRGVA